jgi:hypothetical protein
MDKNRRDIDLIQTSFPLNVIECNSMKVRNWREGLRSPSVGKISCIKIH